MASAALERPCEVDERAESQQDEKADILSDTQSLRVRKQRAHGRPRSRIAKRVILIAICAVIVVALAVVACLEADRISHERERLAEQERALNTPQPVEVTLGIPPSDATNDMPVAIRVTGTAQNGSKIDEAQVVSLDKPILELLPGTYTACLEGDCLSSDGFLYRGSSDTFEFSVTTDNVPFGDDQPNQEEAAKDDAEASPEDEPSQETKTVPVFAFLVVPPQQVVDEDLESVRSWLEAAGSDPTPYVDAASARRTEAIERIRTEGEAKDAEQMSQVEGIVGYVNEQLYARELAKAEEAKKKEDASENASQADEQQEEDKQ